MGMVWGVEACVVSKITWRLDSRLTRRLDSKIMSSVPRSMYVCSGWAGLGLRKPEKRRALMEGGWKT